MDKILISLYVPSINERYDMNIPRFMKIKDLIDLLSQAIENLSNGRYISSHGEILCLMNQQILLFNDKRIEDYNIQNGDVLMML
ncbi:MAG: hypothetical protein ACI4SR_00265 [Faecalibacillus sp.]